MDEKTQKRLKKLLPNGIPNFNHESWLENPQKAFKGNCENIITAVPVPVGICGPFFIKNDVQKYVLPLATTEAALIASVNRGAKALSANNNAILVESTHKGICRAPVFELKQSKTTQEIEEIIKKGEKQIEKAIKMVSNHTKLMKWEVKVEKNLLFVRFWFATGAAMGMNMATIATKSICEHFFCTNKGINAKLLAVSSNWCADKKPSAEIAKKGKKFSVKAQSFVSNSVLKDVLKTNAKDLMATFHAKIQKGSKYAHLLGKNAHVANIIAASFIALGQDVAHTVEGSITNTKVVQEKEGITISVEIPALVCGTFGGGTQLAVQNKLLNLTGINLEEQNTKTAQKLAEIVACGVLTGELSLLSALSAGHLAIAHAKLRKK